MKRAGVKVGVGTRFSYDGEIIEIVEWHMVNGAVEVLAKDLRSDGPPVRTERVDVDRAFSASCRGPR
jgi:hypothetical protein